MRDGLHYRQSAFQHGMRVNGYEVRVHISDPRPGDVLVIWNRSFRGAEDAQHFERAGATVVVAENGYLGKGWRGGNWYSLALGHHAGVGSWPHGGPSRWDSFGVELAPWRTGGTETVIIGQRGIGEYGIKSPDGWAEGAQQRYGGRIRPHPGKHNKGGPLADDLVNARCVLTWASSAALQALALGVPVYYELPGWIGAGASRPLAEFDKEPLRDDAARLEMFRRMAWTMWQIDEIDNGTALAHVLGKQECLTS